MSEDYTYDRVEVVAISREELAALRQRVADLEGQRLTLQEAVAVADKLNSVQRVKELEAQLVAIPVEALRRYMRYSDGTHHRYSTDKERLDRAAIAAWLGMLAGKQPQS